MTLQINWRQQLAQIDPYLNARGGVIHIRGGMQSAASNFIKLLRWHMQDRQFLQVELNPEDEQTRNPVDILTKLEAKLNLGPLEGQQVQVASGLQAQGGGITIKDIKVDIGSMPYYQSTILHQGAKRIVNVIANRIQHQRVAIILFNVHAMTRRSRAWFWNHLWDNGLENFVESGFMVVIVFDPSEDDGTVDRLSPNPDCVVDLPVQYSNDDRDHALDDITKLVFERMGTEDKIRARNLSDGILMACEDRPGDVHDRLPAVLLKLGKEA